MYLSVLLIGLLAALWLASRLTATDGDEIEARRPPTADAPVTRVEPPAPPREEDAGGPTDAGTDGTEAELVWVSLAPPGTTGAGSVIARVSWKKLLPWERLPDGATADALEAYYAVKYRNRDPAEVLRVAEEGGLVLAALPELDSPWAALIALRVESIRAEVEQDRAEEEAADAFEEAHGVPPREARREARAEWKASRPLLDPSPQVEAALEARERWPDSEAWGYLTLHAADAIWNQAFDQGGEEQGWALCLELLETEDPTLVWAARQLVLGSSQWEFDLDVAQQLRDSLQVDDRDAEMVGFFVLHAALRAEAWEEAASWFALLEQGSPCRGVDVRTNEEVIANAHSNMRMFMCRDQAQVEPVLISMGVRSADTDWWLPVAPDRLHKADISGGPPYAILASTTPSGACADASFRFEDGHVMPFVEYLRLAFRWGGFPGIAQRNIGPRKVDLMRFARDLLPL